MRLGYLILPRRFQDAGAFYCPEAGFTPCFPIPLSKKIDVDFIRGASDIYAAQIPMVGILAFATTNRNLP